MIDDQLEAELNELSEEEREETEFLLRLARVHKATKPQMIDIKKRVEEKNLTFNESRRELRNEVSLLQEEIVANASKTLRKNLSKNVREKLGIKSSGRPKGSKNKKAIISKAELYKRLRRIVKKDNQAGIETKQEEVARKLDLGGARQLRRLLTAYGEIRSWKDLRSYLLAESD